MILVAGGTGRLGSILVPRLVAGGHAVRVLTRDRSRAAHLGRDADVAVGDVRDLATVEAAMGDVHTIVSAVHGFAGPGHVTPRSVDRDGNANLVRAAVDAGAEVVLVSVVGAAPDSPMELFRAKYEAEADLRATDLSWTIVRSTAFVELWADLLIKPIVFGQGANPINFVSVHDVAAVIERSISDPSLRGQVLEVGGPQNLTFDQLAGMVQDARGEHRRVRHIPRPLLRAMAVVDRRAAAAMAMDTTDMTFDAASCRYLFADLALTDPSRALMVALGSPASS